MSRPDTKPRLGRGLAALMGDAPETPSGEIAVDDLQPGPFQPRRNMAAAALSELTESIRERGVLQPILVRPHPSEEGSFQIIAGERRWRAARDAGFNTVPVSIRTLSDADAMAASLVENLQRQDLNAIEEAEGYRRLIDEFGLTQEKLAASVGKSRSHVANTLRLLQLPAAVQHEVRQGALSAGHARALLSHPAPEKAALAVIARGLNVRQTEALAAPREPPSPVKADPETAALERNLSEKLGLRVQIGFDGSGGQVRIFYQSLDQLDGIVALLGRD